MATPRTPAVTATTLAAAFRMLADQQAHATVEDGELASFPQGVWLRVHGYPEMAPVFTARGDGAFTGKAHLPPELVPTTPAQAEALGWVHSDTGGGCTAWEYDLRNGTHLCLTDNDGSGQPEDVALWPEFGCPLIGLHDNEDGTELFGAEVALPEGTVVETFTVFCQQANGGGTMFIDSVSAFDATSAIEAGAAKCAHELGVEPDDVKVVGVAAGLVEILSWDDEE